MLGLDFDFLKIGLITLCLVFDGIVKGMKQRVNAGLSKSIPFFLSITTSYFDKLYPFELV